VENRKLVAPVRDGRRDGQWLTKRFSHVEPPVHGVSSSENSAHAPMSQNEG